MTLPKREAAKLLILDPDDRVLLFRAEPPAGQPPYWMAPGGGVEPGETIADAARREMREETGAALPLGPPVWRRTFVFTALDRVTKEQTETFFLVRADVPFDWQLTHDLTSEAITTARWWAIEEITAAETEVFYPENLAEELRSLLSAELPKQPVVLDTVR